MNRKAGFHELNGDPFRKADELLQKTRGQRRPARIPRRKHFEKIALGWY